VCHCRANDARKTGNEEEDKDKWTCTFITQVYGAWLNGDDEEFDRLNGDLINFYGTQRIYTSSSSSRNAQIVS
jgi:hypothetical protein